MMNEIAFARLAAPTGLGMVMVVFGFFDWAIPAAVAVQTCLSSMPAGTWGEWFGAIATFAAVLVALWPFLKERLHRPRLLFSPLDLENDSDSFPGPQHYFRFRVKNDATAAARNVQVIVNRAFTDDGQGLRRIKGFLPCNLVWTNDLKRIKRLTADIHGMLHRHCDIGVIVPGHTDVPDGTDLDKIRPFIVQTNIQPSNQFNHLKPGISKLELQLLADNFEPVLYTLTIDWSGRWHDQIEQVVAKEITMKLEKGGIAG